MNKKSIIKILNQELATLKDITEGFTDTETIIPIEIELALSKTTDIYNLIAFLKDDNNNASLKEIPKAVATNHVKNEESTITEQKTEPIINKIETETTEIDIKDGVTIDENKNTQENDIPEIKIQIPEPVESITEKGKPIIIPTEKIEEEEEEIIIETEILEENTSPTTPEEEQLDKNTPEEIEEVASPNNNKKSGIVADQFAEKSLSVNDMLSSFKKDKNLAGLLTDRPVNDLKKAVKLNDRIWYIRELFSNNTNDYNNAIDYINGLSNLDEALAYVFKNHDWDQHKKSTISFLELLYRRFAVE